MSKKTEKKECGCGCAAAGAKLQPLDDRVVVKRLEAEEKTAGGIILPDNAKEKPQRGQVVAVGPGKLLDSGNRATPDVATGDTVLFGKYSGTEVKVDGVELLIMRENDILAKL
ncbi:MAG: co-chaperone GroES [Planctomycetes bacterium]|nr:co-chaperone GroES [Planctomycetota bacterium]